MWDRLRPGAAFPRSAGAGCQIPDCSDAIGLGVRTERCATLGDPR